MAFNGKSRRVDLMRFHLDENSRPEACFGYCRGGEDVLHGYFNDEASAKRWSELVNFSAPTPSLEHSTSYTNESFSKLEIEEAQEKLLSVEAYYDHQMRKLVPGAAYLHYEPATDHRPARVRFTNVNNRQLKTVVDLERYPMIEGFMLYNDGAGITEDGVQTFELMTNEDILEELAFKEEDGTSNEYEILKNA